ncbi:MAG TPA: DUF3866 family protein [Acidimicrobiales bacterium]|nr:DUF3866 family protein [Acidimicrobiales bacterium]
MPRFRTGTVTAITSERDGLQRVEVDRRPAYVLTRLIGPVAVGDAVVVNTTAVDLGLGTGGWDVVHWNLARDEWDQPGAGHVMKLRYTSLQIDAGVAEEAEGYTPPTDLGGVPVIACALHSQVACVAAAMADTAPGARLVYVMTDAGALPLALSDLVADLRDVGWLQATVTVGQAFGGEHEAVNLRSGLDVARAVAGADVIVVGTGPGVVGTGTRHGFSGLEVAGIIDLAGSGGGRPVVALRWSDADSRPRHRGLSHHSLTALAYAHHGATVAVPEGYPAPELGAPHRIIETEVPDVGAMLDDAGLRVTTMGRGPEEDPGFFDFAAAAGVVGAGLLSS